MANRFTLAIIVPEKVYFQGEVDSISIVTGEGELTIMAHHLDMISDVAISQLTIRANGHVNAYAVGGGAMNILMKENKVVLYLNSIESVEDIDLNRALAAKEKAEKALNEAKSLREQQKSEIKLKRALNRIDVKNKSH